MKNYEQKLRAFDGLDCFQAEGKFCHTTGSINSGYGVCCDPKYEGDNCQNKDIMRCSQPLMAADTFPKYKNVISDQKYNNQYFAFLPTSPYKCGISDKIEDYFEGSMKLGALHKRQQISLVGYKAALKYTESENGRNFESCFYEINAVDK